MGIPNKYTRPNYGLAYATKHLEEMYSSYLQEIKDHAWLKIRKNIPDGFNIKKEDLKVGIDLRLRLPKDD